MGMSHVTGGRIPSVEAMGEMDREKNRRQRGRNDGDKSNICKSRSISNPAGKKLIRILPPSFLLFLWMGMGEGDAEGQEKHPR